MDDSERILTDIESAAVKIDPLQLQDEFVGLPSQLAHWGAKTALANEEYLEADLAYDQMKAMLDIELRERLTDEGAGDKKFKMTENTLAAHVMTDKRYIEARLNRIDAEAKYDRVKAIVTALLAKKDALVSIGASVRAEMEGSPSIRSQHRHAHGKDD